MAGLLEDSVDQGQGALQGLGAAAEQAAQNQVRNMELQTGRQQAVQGLMRSLGETIESGLQRSREEAGRRKQEHDQAMREQAPPPPPPPPRSQYLGMFDPSGTDALGDPMSQMLGSVMSRMTGGVLDNMAAPIAEDQ
jgi:hypothetical protein